MKQAVNFILHSVHNAKYVHVSWRFT